MADKTCYIIAFDLPVASKLRPKLVEAIKAYGGWAKITMNTWAIKSEVSPAQIRDELRSIAGLQSRIFVLKSGYSAAWANVFCRGEWLKRNL
ncbi:MAG TPA: CRISPR-associated protein Cas2 [bacterium]|jgi:hypothetical protein|nr:CRISPR-associated protein Cas2 [bacterium]